MKRITKVTITHVADTDPDTSFLGEYTDSLEDGHILVSTGEFVDDVAAEDIPQKGRDFRCFCPYAGGLKLSDKDYRQYALQDFRRMDALQRQEWYFLGVRAQAQVEVSPDGKTWTVHCLTSPGLWGIESDSDEKHLEETAKDELAHLRESLLEFGFTRRQVSSAFKKCDIQNPEYR